MYVTAAQATQYTEPPALVSFAESIHWLCPHPGLDWGRTCFQTPLTAGRTHSFPAVWWRPPSSCWLLGKDGSQLLEKTPILPRGHPGSHSMGAASPWPAAACPSYSFSASGLRKLCFKGLTWLGQAHQDSLPFAQECNHGNEVSLDS